MYLLPESPIAAVRVYMANDSIQTVLTLLSDNWTAGNTDSITPKFQKITSELAYSYNESQDWVFAQRPRQEVSPAGIGPANKHEVDRFELDIRVRGADQESHFLNVIEEIKRILDDNKIAPSSPYDVVEFDGLVTDLSDKTRQTWRAMLQVQLFQYNVAR